MTKGSHQADCAVSSSSRAFAPPAALLLCALLLVLLPPGTSNAEAPGFRLPAVRLEGNYFAAGSRHFLVVGAHWVPAKTGLQWPLQWAPKDIEADFAKMAEMGFNTVRLDLFWGWFEPRPGDYSDAAFKQLDFLILMAHRYHVYLHPTLFVGGEVGEAY